MAFAERRDAARGPSDARHAAADEHAKVSASVPQDAGASAAAGARAARERNKRERSMRDDGVCAPCRGALVVVRLPRPVRARRAGDRDRVIGFRRSICGVVGGRKTQSPINTGNTRETQGKCSSSTRITGCAPPPQRERARDKFRTGRSRSAAGGCRGGRAFRGRAAVGNAVKGVKKRLAAARGQLVSAPAAGTVVVYFRRSND